MTKVMFVCTGNICRSPMAHYYMQKRVKDLKIENDFWISSCGVYANQGDRATQNAIEVMEAYNVDVMLHRATNVDESDIENFDYIFCLTKQHKETVLSLYETLQGKVFTMKEFVDPNISYLDIDDPWGYHKTVYEQCAKEIVEYVDKIVDKLKGCE